jgi:hypothetical protein
MEQLIDHIVTAQTIGDIHEENETKPSISSVVSLNEVVLIVYIRYILIYHV